MANITNIIEQSNDGKHQLRNESAIEGLMIHRVGTDRKSGITTGYDGPSIVNAFLGRVPKFKDVAAVTGGQNAYSFFIGGDCGPTEYDGVIWQTLPLTEVGWHARRFSTPYIGFGCIFDGRVAPPSPKQWESLVELVAECCIALGKDPHTHIKGHGEVPGAHDGTKAPGKLYACPGDFFKMDQFRDAVALRMQVCARLRLKANGLTFSL